MANNLFDITQRINERLGFTQFPGDKVNAPEGMAWDAAFGNMTFLYAMSDQNPMLRETAEFRRERIDTERNPGEQSLDSGYWVRSQESWHYGSGLRSAEPLEVEAGEASFRYARGGGVDPWTAGELTLLHDTEQLEASTSSVFDVLGTTEGILVRDDAGVHMLNTDGSTDWSYANANLTSLTTDGESWYAGTNDGKIYSAVLTSGSGSLYYNSTITEDTLVRWVKGRIIAAFGREVWEGAGGTWTQLDPGTTFPSTWAWQDVADGPTSIYITGFSGTSSEIYKIDVTVDNNNVTLGALTSTAEMPRGESVRTLYSYIGTFILLGTSSGVRVAVIGDTGNLSVGPLLRESTDGAYDFVAVGSYVYAAVGSDGNAGNRVSKPGLVRINLGQTLNNSALDFAIADDLVVDGSGSCVSVTYQGDKIVLAVTGEGVYVQSDLFVSEGWLESGRIRLGTTEDKTWRDLRLLAQVGSPGSVIALAVREDDSSEPSSWQEVVQVTGERYDATGKVSSNPNEPATSLYVALNLRASDDQSESPVLRSYQLRAIPSPQRTRLLRIPLQLFDFEVDRAGMTMGYPGFAHDRLLALEALEQSYALVPYIDYTTNEQQTIYIERLSYSRTAPPNHNSANDGGIVTVLARVV
jgi:hypothetical protein